MFPFSNLPISLPPPPRIQTKAERAQELARVKISKDDVDLIMNEMMVSRTVAETKLREHRGNVVDALMELVQ